MSQENTVSVYLYSIARELLASAAAGAAYEQWSDNFSRKDIREIWLNEEALLRRKLERQLTISDLVSLDNQDLDNLGFKIFKQLRLIPLWLYNYITDGEKLFGINGNVYIKGKDEIHLDHRSGCIAYGFN